MKIAVCFFGQSRDVSPSSISIKNNLINLYECDVFIHTWEHDKYKLDDINLVYSPKSIMIESQINFNDEYIDIIGNLNSSSGISNFNTISQFYSHYKSHLLMLDYSNKNNIKYDLIVKIRTDTYLYNTFNIKDIIPNNYNVPSIPNGYIYNDTIAISDEYVMNLIALKFNNIVNLNKEANGNFIPENIIHNVLNNNNIAINRINNWHCDLYRTLNK